MSVNQTELERKMIEKDLHEAVRNNKICIREISQSKLCQPKPPKACPFSHDVPHDLDNRTRDTLMLLWSEQHDKCAFEFTKKGSCKDKESCKHCSNRNNIASSPKSRNPKYCYNELKQKNSCGRTACKFEHNIPEQLQQNNEAKINYIEEERKKSKCINEYRKAGSCRKQGDCRFSHDISQEDRQNPALQKQMKEKYEKITNFKKESSRDTVTGNSLNTNTIQLIQQLLSQLSGITNENQNRNSP